jgi:4a-hydroxytetrahydrobiopterin dehydratase
MGKPLQNDAIMKALASLDGWQYESGKLLKTIDLKDFSEALVFINKVGQIAEKQNHHPEIINNYRRVTLKLCTHDADDKVTEKDLTLAQAIQLLCSHD